MEKEEQPQEFAEARRRLNEEGVPLWDEAFHCGVKVEELEQELQKVPQVDAPGEEPSLSTYVFEPAGYVLGWLLLFNGVYFLLGLMVDNLKGADLPWSYGLITVAIVATIGYIIYRFKMAGYQKRDIEYTTSDFYRISQEIKKENDKFKELRKKLTPIYEEVMPKYAELYPEEALQEQVAKGEEILGSALSQMDFLWKSASNRVDRCLEKSIKEIPEELIGSMEDGEAIHPKYDEPEPTEWAEKIATVWIYYAGALALTAAFGGCAWLLKKLFSTDWDVWLLLQLCLFAIFIPLVATFFMLIFQLNQASKWGKRKEEFDTLVARRNDLAKIFHEEETNQEIFLTLHSELDLRRDDVLRNMFAEQLTLPVRSFELGKWGEAQRTYLGLKENFDKLNETPAADRKQAVYDYFNTKLDIFYSLSIPAEAGENKEILRPFDNLTVEEMRSTFAPAEATIANVRKLQERIGSLVDIHAVIEDFNEAVDIDTSGTFTKNDSKKVEEKTRLMKAQHDNFTGAMTKYRAAVSRINTALGLARMVAYRNLYLGAELISVVTFHHGGGKLERMNDSLADIDIVLTDAQIESGPGMQEAMLNIVGDSLDSVFDCVNSVLNDKAATKYYSQNPKEALAAMAGVAVMTALNSAIDNWNKRNKRIAECLELQEQMIENMENMVTQYLDTEAGARRALELIESLIKMNDGFKGIYEPLRAKVFDRKNPEGVSKNDIMELVMAMKNYKKVSDSKL